MNIAMLIYHYFPYGGQQRDFLKIINACSAAGHQVDVYCLKWQGDKPPAGVRVHIVPVSALSRHVLYQRYTEWTQSALRKSPPDVVMGFSKMPGLDIYFAADPCFAARMQSEQRYLSRVLPRYRHFMAYERSVFAPGSKTQVLLLSPQQQQDFLQYYPQCTERLHMLSPGISRDRCPDGDIVLHRESQRQRLLSELQSAEHSLLILQIGSGFRVKGVDRSIRALASLPDELGRRALLLLVGQDKPDRYKRLAAKLGVAERIRFLGGRDDVPMFLAGSDLLLHPAYHESAGYTILEAIINGLPVLTTDTCGFAYHVRQAGAGLVSPSPFSQRDLNARLHEMLISSDREKWRQNGLQYANKVELFGMAEQALMIIEQTARSLRSA
ncbi:glycosyltransferase family 4 protein [Pseudohongiella spirulinae]|uniref:Glucosyltransferase I RfaG n=1 Tax=Pseudohongiella spirulinae TaxID=1249552 RepID=A0A0S2KA31_9GAMM|nr:glycosyltransferase family 4 protein [Pseudohongiella spirulinae]ALO44997.1 glucosyltransferase I RfaG [Pseudohongiella spirulinae]